MDPLCLRSNSGNSVRLPDARHAGLLSLHLALLLVDAFGLPSQCQQQFDHYQGGPTPVLLRRESGRQDHPKQEDQSNPARHVQHGRHVRGGYERPTDGGVPDND
jgi:hypothetical protein